MNIEENYNERTVRLEKYKSYTLVHVFKEFRDRDRLWCKTRGVSKKLFIDVCTLYNNILISEIFNSGYKTHTPIGTFCLRATKINYNKLKINFNLTKQLGYTVYHLNEHSGGKYYNMYWDKTILKNISFYNFKFLKTEKQQLTKLIRDGKVK